jgi:hypothetical protein
MAASSVRAVSGGKQRAPGGAVVDASQVFMSSCTARRLPVSAEDCQKESTMDLPKPERPDQGGDEPELDDAMKALGHAVHDAEESLLDLEDAIAALRVARDPALALQIEVATVACLAEAMRR